MRTGAGEIATETLRAAGLDWLLAADEATPQTFLSDLSGRCPGNYDKDATRQASANAGAKALGLPHDEPRRTETREDGPRFGCQAS